MELNGKTELYGIMGHPVSHSLSPAMHNAAFAHCNLNCAYGAFDVVDVESAMKGMKALGIKGASVTIPHKQAVIPFLDEIDPVAKKIGAVNTLVIRNGLIRGYNTDWQGANQALEMISNLDGARVLILGAGGAARAIGFGLQEKGATIVLANRTIERGRALARDLGCEFIPLTDVAEISADILVNTTAAGMSPNVEETPAPKEMLKSISAVMDIVYSPRETRLLKEAKEAGCKTVNGTYMLLFQGVAQFELWTGLNAPIDLMRDKLFARLE